MKEIRGNIFDQKDANAICVTTNGVIKQNGELVMGAGIALQFANRCKNDKGSLAKNLGTLVTKNGNHVTDCIWILSSNLTQGTQVVSFPTKEHWRDSSPLWLIERSAKELVELADKRGWMKIVLPRPGCAHGGRDWETEVKPILEKYLDDRFYIITP